MSASAPSTFFPKPYADFVAKLRVPAGFLLLVAFAWFSAPTRESALLGTLLSLPGLLLRGWAAGHLRKDSTLTTSGPYAFIRNPLYAGTLLVAAGMAYAAQQWPLAILFGAVFLQMTLGVFAVLTRVWVSAGVLHQFGAVLLLTARITVLHRTGRPVPLQGGGHAPDVAADAAGHRGQ